MYSGDKTSSCPGAWEDKRRWYKMKAWKSGTAILSKGSFFDYGCLFRQFDLVGRELWLHLWTHPLHVDGVSRAPPHTGSEKSVSPANWLLGGWIHFASLAGTAFLQCWQRWLSSPPEVTGAKKVNSPPGIHCAPSGEGVLLFMFLHRWLILGRLADC